jgi:Adenylate kinase
MLMSTCANISFTVKQGKIVPVEVTIRLLKAAMERSGARDFLIDGFPRSPDNLDGWFQVMGDQAEVYIYTYSIIYIYYIYIYVILYVLIV